NGRDDSDHCSCNEPLPGLVRREIFRGLLPDTVAVDSGHVEISYFTASRSTKRGCPALSQQWLPLILSLDRMMRIFCETLLPRGLLWRSSQMPIVCGRLRLGSTSCATGSMN